MSSKYATVSEMICHIDQLVEENQIIRYRVARSMRSCASWECWEIHIPDIRSIVSYTTALHEIGHLMGRYRASKLVMVRERDAWRWAKAHALQWDARMDKQAADCLAWYEQRIAEGKMSRKVQPTIYG
jgi:hypothetical protein